MKTCKHNANRSLQASEAQARANKTNTKHDRASHDGFLPVHHEGQWLFQEGRKPRLMLSQKESQAIERAFKRKGLKKNKSVAPPEIW